jgi:hypothetical protein
VRAAIATIRQSPAPPWIDAFYTVISLITIDYNLNELLSEEMAFRLSTLGWLDYPKIKEIWNSFTNEEKIEALNGIISGIASYGLKELLESAAYDILKWRGPGERQKAIRAAKEFLSGRIDFDILAYRIIEALWPTPEERIEHDADIEGFWKGAELSDYVSEKELKEIVKEDFLNVLESYGPEG